MYPSGRYVSPLDMRPEDLDIRDIAHHLSQVCRYTGGTPFHYSVAQHSVLVSQYFTDRDGKLAGLLHDAAEAYLNDLASPVKHDPRLAFFVEADQRLSSMIFERFGLDPDLIKKTKPFDGLVFQRERQSFFGKGNCTIAQKLPWQARQMFLNEFRKLNPSWTGYTAGTITTGS